MTSQRHKINGTVFYWIASVHRLVPSAVAHELAMAELHRAASQRLPLQYCVHAAIYREAM